MHIFIELYLSFTQHEFHESVGFKGDEDKDYVIFASIPKLRRIILTLTALYCELKNGNIIDFGIDRLGSHILEQFIGKLRLICKGDNRFETIIHNLARLQFVSNDFKECYLKPREKRLNIGGCKISTQGADFNFELAPIDVANSLLNIVQLCDLNEEKYVFPQFLENLKSFNSRHPYKNFNYPAETSNQEIIDRLRAGSELYRGPKEWNPMEDDLIDTLIMKNEANLLKCKNFNCTKTELRKKIKSRKKILSKRVWMLQEDNIIRGVIQKTYTLREASKILYCREKEDIKRRIEFLKKDPVSLAYR